MTMFEQSTRTATGAHLEAVQRQFRRQAEAYSAMPVVTDPEFLSYIVSISGVSKGDSVIDVASGPGFVAIAFAPHCGRVIGIDATDRFVARATGEAERRRLDNVAFMLGDAEQMAFPDHAFDVAVCRFAFHHFPRPTVVLAEMRRLVRPGGTIVLVDMVAAEDPVKANYHNDLERLCDPSHARALPASEFERMFARQGLDLTYKQTVKSTYSLEDWIAHGAPTPDRAARILEMMEASANEDKSGLNVRITNGRLFFSHTGASYVMRRRP